MSRKPHSGFDVGDLLVLMFKMLGIVISSLVGLLAMLIPMLGRLLGHIFHLFDSTRITSHPDGTQVTQQTTRGILITEKSKTSDGPCWKCNGCGFTGPGKTRCSKCGGTGRYHKVVTESRRS